MRSNQITQIYRHYFTYRHDLYDSKLNGITISSTTILMLSDSS